MTRKFHIVSPRDPSGATWLINCFLKLGIVCYRGSKDQVWQKIGDGQYKLTESEEILKKWLPILSENVVFNFREDVEVEWSHSWPTQIHERYKIIYFIRDPRDAIYSRYKREMPAVSFTEFLETPDPFYLLDKIDYWKYFNRLWLTHPNLKVFKFESYRRDAVETLKDILKWIELDQCEADIHEAITASTSEKAAKAEASIGALSVSSKEMNQVMNQGGIVGRWKLDSNVTENLIKDLENRCRTELALLNYIETDKSIEIPAEIKLPMQFKNLTSLQQIRPFGGTAYSFEETSSSTKSVNYCFNKSLAWLRASGLDAQGIKRLFQSTEVFLRNDFLNKKESLNISLLPAGWEMFKIKLFNKWYKISRIQQRVGE